MSDAEVDRMGERVARYGRKLFMISAWIPFHNLPLLDLDVKTMTRHPGFLKEFKAGVRAMHINYAKLKALIARVEGSTAG